MNKMDILWQLRRCHNLVTLEKVVGIKQYKLLPGDQNALELAADHRRAEIITGRLYDHVPKHVWQLVR
ncbi:Hha/YmoA family nucleoid-associated regulatory protein [Klebsiella aerogenes]|uniref:Hha/YmoA family nucleoid-associated regulatory protein n=1 Tax=Klebsiella aerogenes TaxID=548 RepID=UPI002E2EA567|nr:Hha/YmoA family nucleoid-associated regulatory protein [Klebsiella aerogenes]MED7793177.1 Hha/YmoA family nucleoid-associated regulatory protein [Klebsiella aerogenes]